MVAPPVLHRGKRYCETMGKLKSANLSSTYCDPRHQDEEKINLTWRILSFFPPTLHYSNQQPSNAMNGGSLLSGIGYSIVVTGKKKWRLW